MTLCLAVYFRWDTKSTATKEKLDRLDFKFKISHQRRYQESKISQALVAHACNPSYSGCRDQEDCGLKPAQANSS
jgi:hypothetical protein